MEQVKLCLTMTSCGKTVLSKTVSNWVFILLLNLLLMHKMRDLAGVGDLGFRDQKIPRTRTLPFTRPCSCAGGKKFLPFIFIQIWKKLNAVAVTKHNFDQKIMNVYRSVFGFTPTSHGRIRIRYYSSPSFFPWLALDVKKYSWGKWQKLDFTS